MIAHSITTKRIPVRILGKCKQIPYSPVKCLTLPTVMFAIGPFVSPCETSNWLRSRTRRNRDEEFPQRERLKFPVLRLRVARSHHPVSTCMIEAMNYPGAKYWEMTADGLAREGGLGA